MDGTSGKSAIYLKTDLLNRGRTFSFFQVIRLLKLLCGENSRIPVSRLKVRPNLSLAFPGSGIESITESDTGTFTVKSNILGLYGTCSPLPTFYTEDLIDDVTNGDHSIRDLIDVINHRLYELLFSAWSKYRSMLKMIDEKDNASTQRFYSLIGMNEESLNHEFDEPLRLLRYTGLFGMNSRSASGLETLLSDALGRIPIRVIQMVDRKRMIHNDQKCCLGKNIRLGMTASLGHELPMRTGAFRIEIGPVNDTDYRRLIPGNPDYVKLLSLVKLYASKPLDYDVDIIMDKKEKPGTVCLGSEKFSSLGFDTWIFSDEGPAEFKTRFYPEKNAA